MCVMTRLVNNKIKYFSNGPSVNWQVTDSPDVTNSFWTPWSYYKDNVVVLMHCYKCIYIYKDFT